MELLLLLTVFPAYMIGRFFVRYDPGPAEPRSALKLAVAFGLLSIVLALVLSTIVSLVFSIDIELLAPAVSADFIVPILIFATIEEVVKFVPLALYVYKRNYFNEYTDGIIYFAFVGLTFGAIESFLYAVVGGSFGFFVALLRLSLGFFFHAATTSLVGYYLARKKIRGGGMAPVVIAFFVACIAHTLYNVGAFAVYQYPITIFLSAATAIVMNVIMFWLYYRASEADIALGFRRGVTLQTQTTIQYQQSVVTTQQQVVPQNNQAVQTQHSTTASHQ